VTLFLVAAGILSIASLALLLWPLLRRRGPVAEPRAAYDLRLYRDQLAEVDRDRVRGLLGAEEAEATRIEIKRRMLAAAGAGVVVAKPADAPPPPRPRRVWVGVLAVLLPGAAALLYLELGAPGVPDRPLAERRAAAMSAGRQPAAGEPVSLEDAAAQLAKRLESRPDDATGWLLLGRAYLTLNRPAEALPALARARDLAPDQPEVVAAFADAAIAVADGRIDDASRAALASLLALEPDSPKARFLLALDRAQQGDLPGAVQGWTDLLALSAADAPWVATVREHIQRAAKEAGLDPATVQPSPEARALAARIAAAQPPEAAAGPGPADVAAAAQMPPEERAQMVRGMVDRLAARLREHPDDLEGWRRLARAYDVLNEPAKAEEARARIAALERR